MSARLTRLVVPISSTSSDDSVTAIENVGVETVCAAAGYVAARTAQTHTEITGRHLGIRTIMLYRTQRLQPARRGTSTGGERLRADLQVGLTSLREHAAEFALDETLQRRAKAAIGGDELPAVVGQSQRRARTGPTVLEEGEAGGLFELAQQSPRVPVRHVHALRGLAQRSVAVDSLEQRGLAVAEQRVGTEREPELRLDAQRARPHRPARRATNGPA